MNKSCTLSVIVAAALLAASSAQAWWWSKPADRDLAGLSDVLKGVLEKGKLPSTVPTNEAPGLGDSSNGVVADFKAWVTFYRDYITQNDTYNGVIPVPLLAQWRHDPLDIPWRVEQWERRIVDTPAGIEGALNSAINLVGALPEETAASRPVKTAPAARQAPAPQQEAPAIPLSPATARWVQQFAAASEIVDREALGAVTPESRRLMQFVVPWICSVGEPFTNKSKGAPGYCFNWYFEPSDPFGPGDTVTTLSKLPIPREFSSQDGARPYAGISSYLYQLAGQSLPPSTNAVQPSATYGTVNMAAMGKALEILRGMLVREKLESWKQALLKTPDIQTLVPGVDGTVKAVLDSPYGRIVIGGPGWNVYRDVDAAVIIDLGGDDDYVFTKSEQQIGVFPVSMIVDYEGDDLYQVARVGGPGVGILGISVLLDLKGNDRYCQGLSPLFEPRKNTRDTLVEKDPEGVDTRIVPFVKVYGDPAKPDQPGVLLDAGFGFGAGFCGVGVLVDEEGDDLYLGQKYVFGAAMWRAVGLLQDGGGNDVYVTGLASIGVGINGAFGVLDDRGGNDHYQCLGLHESGYSAGQEWDNGYDGWGIGGGSSWRAENRGKEPKPTMGGGIGLVHDGGGDDSYTGSSMGMAAGYAGGVGAIVDDGGNDTYFVKRGPAGDNRSGWSGNHALGNGCHRGIGYLLDRAGNDRYSASGLGGGSGWDLGIGYLMDLGGDDALIDLHGKNEGGNTGWAAACSLAVSFQKGGTDTYERTTYGDAANLGDGYPQTGGNFGFFIEVGPEKDVYPGKEGGPRRYDNNTARADQSKPKKEADGKDYSQGIGLFVDGAMKLK